jgi:hypothetical protein
MIKIVLAGNFPQNGKDRGCSGSKNVGARKIASSKKLEPENFTCHNLFVQNRSLSSMQI